MATVLRNTNPMMAPFVAAFNDLKLQIGAGSKFHLDAYESPIASAVASSLATSLVLANEMMAVWLAHLADTLAHKVADPAPALVKATDLATAITLANAIKADLNTHDGSTTYHYNADTNDVATSDATDQASVNTLLNALKTAINLHMADAPTAHSLRLVDA